MQQPATIQLFLRWLLIIGNLLAIIFVFIGGSIYLFHHGHEPLKIDALSTQHDYTNLRAIFQATLRGSPFGLIESGVMILIATQVARVASLVCFYFTIRDRWFTVISSFILLVMLFSFFGPHSV